MPLQIRSHSNHLVTPWLWNLLPDNDAVSSRWTRHFQVSAKSPFSLLATPIGLDCAGAVRFVRPDGLDLAMNRPGKIIWLTNDEVAERLRELKADSTAWLGRAFTGQFSLAGAQAKTALLNQDGRWGVPQGASPTTHILKPAVAGLDDHDLNEHICLDAARRARPHCRTHSSQALWERDSDRCRPLRPSRVCGSGKPSPPGRSMSSSRSSADDEIPKRRRTKP